MIDSNKTKAQLIDELQDLRRKNENLGKKSFCKSDKGSTSCKQQAQEYLFQTIVTNSTPIVFVYDCDGTILLAEGKMLESIGLNSGEAVDNNIFEMCKHSSEMLKAIQVPLDGKTFDGILHYEHHIFEVFISPNKNPHGDVIGAIGMALDITHHKKQSEALYQSKERFQDIVESTSELITAQDANGRYTYLNYVAERIYGITSNKCVGLSIYDLIHPDDVEKTKEWIQMCIKLKEEEGTIESRHINQRTGKATDMLCNMRFKYGSKGTIQNIYSIARNITGRKQMEIKLRDSEQNNRILIENTPYCIHQISLDYKLISMNPAGLKMLNVESEKDIIGVGYIDFVGETDKEKVQKLFQNALEGKASEFEFKTTFDAIYNSSFIPIYDNNNKIVRIMGITQDITKSKKAEHAIRQSEEKFRDLAELLPEAVFETDQNIMITFANKIALELFGYTQEEISNGLNGLDLIAPKFRKRVKIFFLKRIHGNNNDSTEYLALKKDGSIFPVLFHACSIIKDGKIVGLRGVIINISETKRLQALESKAERLEMAGTIAGQVAHDFNNLLAPLMAYPEFIRDELPLDHNALPYLDDIENATNKIAEINQQLLSLGRRGHYNQEVLNLNETIHQALKITTSLVENITVEIHLEPQLLPVFGGSSQIHRVITNLLNNAIDSMDNKGKIQITSENYYVDSIAGTYDSIPTGEYVKLTITDSGSGITEENLHKVLDPFFTTKTSDKQRGSGLGLSVVSSIIKDHSGYLDLETELGVGTSFYLYFPPTRKIAQGNDEKIIGGSESVLIIDDDSVQRDVSTQLLQKLGYSTNAVESGEKAIEFLKENPHDILVLDMVMTPGIDGAETYRAIRKDNPNQKAIIISGYSETKQIQVVQKLGAGAFIKKPLTKKSIAQALRTELDQKETTTTI